ncbi:hypothetical protein AMJ39_04325 [candidate division TA06 bacterium DG_24]|uniref:NFACT protein RNA binding domain-containing protein n=2 Tax=Bacteria division TA06 TaxID=1156500 RepID=A0A0S8JLL6_UNCT6|nr:MAG: hypothetical protein AMJ39_04325 [candidate division TA06 bacterium DG_24]KPL10552.1 MAG: hypothetical protein AMJ71_02805 [candidate division TA06 bacterium SM1_40]
MTTAREHPSGQVRAVGLLSGGLDSTLAVRVMKEQGIDIYALNFHTGFCLTDHRRALGGRHAGGRSLGNDALRAAAALGVEIEVVDISEEYLEIVTGPKYGYGSAVNPCIDCRIFMLRRAAEQLERLGARFVFTGEVLGQRPMSQHRQTLDLIERKSGLEGLLLRPLSARLLPSTVPEREGWVDRSRLYAIQGRSRKEQMRLAREFGIASYPQPAGGCCFLTDAAYARRFRDLVRHRHGERLRAEEMTLLKVGRHFRLPSGVKAIVGRDEDENRFLERYVEGRSRFFAADFVGPLVLAEGELEESDVGQIASLVARYCDGKHEPVIRVKYDRGEGERELEVHPAREEELDAWRI